MHAQRGLASLAAITVLTGVGAGTAWWTLQGGATPHHAGHHSRANLIATAGQPEASGTPGAKAGNGNRAQRRAAGRTARKPAHTLVVRTLDATSWVQVLDGQGHALVARDVAAHQRLTFSEHHLQLTLGNAGAVALWIGRHYIDPAGHSGEVRHFTIP